VKARNPRIDEIDRFHFSAHRLNEAVGNGDDENCENESPETKKSCNKESPKGGVI
jgi:hypothetical protein